MFLYNYLSGTGEEDAGRELRAVNKEEEQKPPKAAHEVEPCDKDIPFDEDMYNMAIVALCRDSDYLASSSKECCAKFSRTLRLVNTVLALMLTIGFQFYILHKVRQFVTAKAVKNIQDSYAVFEAAMYNETVITPHGYLRGVGAIQPLNFTALSDDEQEAACRIPLSQPLFLFSILFVWTLTILQNIRVIIQRLRLLFVVLPTNGSWEGCLHADENDTVFIKALPCCMKVFLFIIVFLPWLTVNPYLWWVGSRWLIATNNFNDLILNAVALAFVTDLKVLIYFALVSKRSKLELAGTVLQLPGEEASMVPHGLMEANRTLIFAIFATAIVLVYMGVPKPFAINGLQQVLPGYKWDVHDICIPWIEWRYCLGVDCPASLHAAMASLHAAMAGTMNATATNTSVIV